MKIEKTEQYELVLNPAEMAVLGVGYCLLFPPSDMAWFHRQVVGHDVAYEELAAWLAAVISDPVRGDTIGATAQRMLDELKASDIVDSSRVTVVYA